VTITIVLLQGDGQATDYDTEITTELSWLPLQFLCKIKEHHITFQPIIYRPTIATGNYGAVLLNSNDPDVQFFSKFKSCSYYHEICLMDCIIFPRLIIELYRKLGCVKFGNE